MASLELLERELPPAALLFGPDLSRLLKTAYEAMLRHGAHRADAAVLQARLSAADARSLVKFAQTAPFGPFKAIVAVLDGATAQAQNILLKVLEEPPESVRFILVATERPLPAIVSRCQVITVPGADARQEASREVTGAVTAALKAAQAGDLHGLDSALKGWGDAHHAVLSLLLAEAAAGRDPNRLLDRAQARRLLGALGQYLGAHPRLAAHAALVTVLSDREQHA